jgi:hypothetical protein
MSYGVLYQFKGATEQQYRATSAALDPSDGTLPPGQLYHFAGPSADGWVVCVIYDSKENWEDFRDSVVLPRLQQGVEGGFTTPPEATEFEIAREVHA